MLCLATFPSFSLHNVTGYRHSSTYVNVSLHTITGYRHSGKVYTYVNVSLRAVRRSSRTSSTVTKTDNSNTTFSLNMKGTASIPGSVTGMATNQSVIARKLLPYKTGTVACYL